eukprot:3773082-Pleurochrysis_carterae.AAC.4
MCMQRGQPFQSSQLMLSMSPTLGYQSLKDRSRWSLSFLTRASYKFCKLQANRQVEASAMLTTVSANAAARADASNFCPSPITDKLALQPSVSLLANKR